MDQSGDNEIANIYERVLKGDKSALGNLDKIKNSPLKKSQKIPQQIIHPPKVQQTSQDLSKASKSENFRKYLRQKVSEFGNDNPLSKKQAVRKQKQPDKKEYAEPKPFSKVRKRSEIKSEQKNTQITDVKSMLNQEVAPHKTKTTTHNFQSNMNKNVIKDSVTEKDKHSTPPSSKHSFRIRAQGGSKKLLQQLMRLNEEEKKLQTQILHFHKDHKEMIGEVCQKYKIKNLDSQYVTNDDNIADQHLENIDSPGKNFLKLHKGFLGIEQAKIITLNKQISSLSKDIELKKNEIAKKQAKIQTLPLYILLANVPPDIFEERESEEEQNQSVGQLQGMESKNIDPNKTYQSVMIQMRKKKWGLNQRINYESQNVKSNEIKPAVQKSPPKGVVFSPAKVEGGEDNKIVVNSRLKQFLFD